MYSNYLQGKSKEGQSLANMGSLPDQESLPTVNNVLFLSTCRMYQVTVQGEEPYLCNSADLPDWARVVYNADRRDAYAEKRDRAAGRLSLSAAGPKDQPTGPTMGIEAMPKRIKWLQALGPEKFEVAVNRLLADYWAKEKARK